MIKSYAKKALLQRYLNAIACRYEFCEVNEGAKKQTNHQVTFDEQQQMNLQTQANFVLKTTMQKYYRSTNNQEMLEKINEIFKQKKKVEKGEEEEDEIKEIDEQSGFETFQEGSFREYIHEKEVEKAMQDAALEEIKPISLTPDGIEEMIEHEDEMIYEENNPALFDNIVELENSQGQFNLQAPDRADIEASELFEEMQEYFENGIYKLFKDDQFINFLFEKSQFQEIIPYLPAQFFIQNEYHISNQHIHEIVHQLKKKNISRLNVLRYCQLRNKDNYFDNHKDLTTLINKYPEDVQLIIQYFFFNENKQSFYSLQNFLQSIIQIHWGGQANKQMFQQQLNEVLNLKFKLHKNKELQNYLADLFFGSETFDKGVVAIALHYLLFQRLVSQKDVVDILDVFKSTFGQERYHFYLEQEFPLILQNLKVQSYILIYSKGLKQSNLQKKNEQVRLHALTNLDKIFIKSHQIMIKSTNVFYNPLISNLLYESRGVVQDQERQKIKEAILQNKYEKVEKEISKELQSAQYLPNTAQIAHSYIYQEQLQKKNLKKQCLSDEFLNEEDEEQDMTAAFQKMTFEEQHNLLNEDEQELRQLLLESQQGDVAAEKSVEEEIPEQPILQAVTEAPQEITEAPQEVEETPVDDSGAAPQEKVDLSAIKTIEDLLKVQPEQVELDQRKLSLMDDFEGPSYKIFKKLTEDQPEVLKKRQELFGNNKNQFGFSTLKDLSQMQELPKDEGSGFMNYLKSVQSIDLEVKQQEELSLQQKKLQEVRKPGKIIIDKNEARNLKQIFSEDALNVQKLRQERKQQQPGNEKFERVKQNRYTQEQQGAKVVFKDEQKKAAPLLKEEFVTDNQLDNTDLVNQAKFHIEQFFKVEKQKPILIEEIQNYLSGIQKREDGFHFYLISELIQALENHRPEDSKLIFAQIILQVSNKIKVEESIKISYQTQYGEIQKDFGKYIKQTCTQFSLGTKGYNYLLDFLNTDETYNRLLFKRVLAHYSLNETVLYDSTFEKVQAITKNQKIPQTCAEWFYSLVSKKVQINKTQMRRIAQLLYQFKHFEAEVEELIITLYHQFQWDLKFAEIEQIVVRLLNQAKRDRYMSIYESLKDQIMARKIKELPTEPEEQNKVMAQFKLHQKEMIRDFVRNFAQLLLDTQLPDDARLIINDAKRLRYQYEILDYQLWLLSHVNFFEDSLKIYNDFCVKFPDVYDASIFKAMLTILQSQDYAYDSEESKKLFTKIMEQYIYEKRLPLQHDLIFDITNTYKKLKEYTNFQNFLKFLVQIRYKCQPSHKYLFYRMMNLTETDSVKESIKGIVELLFQDEYQQRKDKRQKGENDQDSKQTEEKTYDLGQRGPNPLHSQEVKAEPTKLDKGKKSKITRGGKVKFRTIEDENIVEKNLDEKSK